MPKRILRFPTGFHQAPIRIPNRPTKGYQKGFCDSQRDSIRHPLGFLIGPQKDTKRILRFPTGFHQAPIRIPNRPTKGYQNGFCDSQQDSIRHPLGFLIGPQKDSKKDSTIPKQDSVRHPLEFLLSLQKESKTWFCDSQQDSLRHPLGFIIGPQKDTKKDSAIPNGVPSGTH